MVHIPVILTPPLLPNQPFFGVLFGFVFPEFEVELAFAIVLGEGVADGAAFFDFVALVYRDLIEF